MTKGAPFQLPLFTTRDGFDQFVCTPFNDIPDRAKNLRIIHLPENPGYGHINAILSEYSHCLIVNDDIMIQDQISILEEELEEPTPLYSTAKLDLVMERLAIWS